MALLLTNGTASIYRKNGSTEGLTQLVSAVSANAQQSKDGAMLDVPGSGVGSDQPAYKALTNIYLGGTDEIGSYSAQSGDLVVFVGSRTPSNWTGTYRVIAETPPAEGFGLDYVKLVCLKESQLTTVNGVVTIGSANVYVLDTFGTPNGSIAGRTPDITATGKTWLGWTDYGTSGGPIQITNGQAVSTISGGYDGGAIDAGISNGSVSATFVTGYGFLYSRLIQEDTPYSYKDYSGIWLSVYKVPSVSSVQYYDVRDSSYHGTVDLSGTPAPGDVYKLTVNANTVTVYRNGASVATLALPDTTSQRTSNLWGFEVVYTGDAIDNFQVTA